MINRREFGEIELKKEEEIITVFISLFFALYSIYYYGFNASSFLYAFLTFIFCLIILLIIHPFLEEKLQLKKINNYSGQKRRAILKMITLPPLLLIWYFFSWIYKYFTN